MGRSIENELPAHVRGLFTRLDPAMQATLVKTTRQLRTYGENIELADILAQLGRQIPDPANTDVRSAVCAATGQYFTANGLCRPYVYVIEPDLGYRDGNIVLVCHAYYLLRRSQRLLHDAGHDRCRVWIQGAAAFLEQFPDWKLRANLDPLRELMGYKTMASIEEEAVQQRKVLGDDIPDEEWQDVSPTD